MPVLRPEGEEYHTKTELGRICGDGFILFWRDFRDGFKKGIDDSLGNIPVIGGALKAPFKAVVDIIYALTWRAIMFLGIRIGDSAYAQIFGRAEEEIDKVIGMLEEAKTKIERELINPIRNKIRTEIEPAVNNLLSRVKSAETTITDAEARINEALTDVANLKDNVASLNKQVNDVRAKVDQTISDFQSRTNKLDIGLGGANIKLGEHTKDITDLFERVKKLEGKTTEQGNLLDWFKGKIGV